MSYTECEDDYAFSERDLLRIADKWVGRYANRLLWEWCKIVEREGVLAIDLESIQNITERTGHVRALTELREDTGFVIQRKNQTTFVIRCAN